MPVNSIPMIRCDGVRHEGPPVTREACDATYSGEAGDDAPGLKRKAKEAGWTFPRHNRIQYVACPQHGGPIAVPRELGRRILSFLITTSGYGGGDLADELGQLLGMAPMIRTGQAERSMPAAPPPWEEPGELPDDHRVDRATEGIEDPELEGKW